MLILTFFSLVFSSVFSSVLYPVSDFQSHIRVFGFTGSSGLSGFTPSFGLVLTESQF